MCKYDRCSQNDCDEAEWSMELSDEEYVKVETCSVGRLRACLHNVFPSGGSSDMYLSRWGD